VAIVGLATIAVVLSPKASTAQVIGASTSGLAQDITAAVNPFSGGSGSSIGSTQMGDIGSLVDGLGTAHL
jgi:hypothetical protein